ncbi:MAG: hypothetical protein A2X36_13915 [Elusimicrobia bacterium GWA2_69_24]|nr:MAG: hypothetical protein A2X36_13915 [Elusimicrobia bacterium GWA2_69_24]HBL16705.1 hypothetical protein [Elusimicrobiota bacterium]
MRGKLLAVAAVLLLAEGLLRGYVHLAEAWRRGRGPASGRIWCVGDSNTRGDGAAQGQGYPEQLGRALGEPVLNLGAGGSNSAQTLDRLERRLERDASPATVFFLAGGNDGWNLREVDLALLRDSRGDRILRSLQGIRLFQAARYVVLRVLPRRGPALGPRGEALDLTAAALNAGDYPKALEQFERFRGADPGGRIRFSTGMDEDLILQELRRLALMQKGAGEPSLYAAPPPPGLTTDEACLYHLGRGWWRLAQGDPGAAAEDFRHLLGLRFNPIQRAEALQGAGWCLLRQGKPREAQERFRAVLKEGDVPVRQARFFWTHAGLVLAASDAGDRQGARRARERLPAPISPAEVRAADRLGGQGAPALAGEGRAPLAGEGGGVPLTSYLECRDHLLFQPEVDAGSRGRVLAFYLSRLKVLSERRHFRAVVLTYPQQSAAGVNGRIREAAAELGLPVVELEGILVDAAGRRFVSRDGYHPDAEGYRRIAERVRRTEFAKG